METTATRSDAYLRQKGIKASFQRVSIFDYLRHTTSHPSVSQIFAALHPTIPSLSRATVYNTINLFVERKIVTPVQVDGTEARYDLTDPRHAHFHCVGCQTIYDIPIDEIGIPDPLKDFDVHESHLHYKGLCPRCR